MHMSLTPLMRWIIFWGVLAAGAAVGTSYLIFIIYWTWQTEGWVKDIVKEHFQATVGLPLAAVGSFLLVAVLQISVGRIEFEAWGFKVRGASGPILFWVITFLAIAFGIRLLW